MNVRYMTLDGRVDKTSFIDEWWNSRDHDATFLETSETIFIMPYGKYSPHLLGQEKVRFAGTYRGHKFVRRDFEIREPIQGGGYLTLCEDRRSCKYNGPSRDFGPVRDEIVAVAAVTAALLQ